MKKRTLLITLLCLLSACATDGKRMSVNNGQCTYREYEVTSKIVGLNEDDATFRIDTTRPYIHVPLRNFPQPPQLGETYRIGVRELITGSCPPFYNWVIEPLLDV